MILRPRILVLGAGDLGRRIAAGLLADATEAHVELTARKDLDLMDTRAVATALRAFRPDVIVQAACLLSPWALPARQELGERAARAVCAAGFAAQLSAQLPILLSVMRAQREAAPAVPVVNCSYPDVTHPMLAPLGLAPTIGIGNASMIHRIVSDVLQGRPNAANAEPPRVRVIAHHAHVTQVVRAAETLAKATRPQVFLGDAAVRDADIAYAGEPRESSVELNALSAATALPIIRALLPGGRPLHTSAPGPLGFGGGYPVVVSREAVVLDLPPSIVPSDAAAFLKASAREDGVERIEPDGTLHYTSSSRDALKAVAPELLGLLDPLAPAGAHARFLALARAL